MEFWEAYLLRATQERAIRVSLIVGTVLVIINQGDLILAGSIPDIWKIPLTYSVPFQEVNGFEPDDT